MIELFEEQNVNYLRRSIETDHIALAINAVVTVFTIFIIGLFVIPLLISKLNAKYETYNELVELTSAVEQKAELIRTMNQQVVDAYVYIDELTIAVPPSPEPEAYAVEMSKVSSASGFIQEKFSVGRRDKSSIEIDSSYSGSPEGTVTFISNLEGIPRDTKIINLNVSVREGISSVATKIVTPFLLR